MHHPRLAAIFQGFQDPPVPAHHDRLLGSYARVVFGRTLRVFLRLGDRFSRSADRELIHDFRVMGRRLSEHLELLAYAVPEPLAVAGKDFLDTLVRELSSVRNADESLALIRQVLKLDLTAIEKEALNRVERRLLRRREKRLDEADRFWRREGSRERVAGLVHLRTAAYRAPKSVRVGFTTAFFQHIRHRAKLALSHLDHLPPEPDDKQLHSMRLDARRLRYVAEATRPLMDWPPKPLLEQLVRVARLLGHHHDLAVAMRRIVREKEGLSSDDPIDARLLKGLARAEARFLRAQNVKSRAFARLSR